jgi:hypothetical protein
MKSRLICSSIKRPSGTSGYLSYTERQSLYDTRAMADDQRSSWRQSRMRASQKSAQAKNLRSQKHQRWKQQESASERPSLISHLSSLLLMTACQCNATLSTSKCQTVRPMLPLKLTTCLTDGVSHDFIRSCWGLRIELFENKEIVAGFASMNESTMR